MFPSFTGRSRFCRDETAAAEAGTALAALGLVSTTTATTAITTTTTSSGGDGGDGGGGGAKRGGLPRRKKLYSMDDYGVNIAHRAELHTSKVSAVMDYPQSRAW